VRLAALALAAVAPFVLAADPSAPRAFSNSAPGALPAPWRLLVAPRAHAPEAGLVDDAGVTVLRVHSADAAGTAAQPLAVDPSRSPVLAWRWKIDRVVEAADLATKAGDDFAARVYVFFDVPSAQLPLGARVKLVLARLLYGEALPAAALCYVWDNRHPAGTSAWSAYTDRVRVIVLESGSARAGEWVGERRDVAADYRAAFGADAPLHEVSGVAAGNDTDQTGESATAWFGDFRFEAAGGMR
jgi:hypothetical protein